MPFDWYDSHCCWLMVFTFLVSESDDVSPRRHSALYQHLYPQPCVQRGTESPAGCKWLEAECHAAFSHSLLKRQIEGNKLSECSDR